MLRKALHPQHTFLHTANILLALSLRVLAHRLLLLSRLEYLQVVERFRSTFPVLQYLMHLGVHLHLLRRELALVFHRVQEPQVAAAKSPCMYPFHIIMHKQHQE